MVYEVSATRLFALADVDKIDTIMRRNAIIAQATPDCYSFFAWQRHMPQANYGLAERIKAGQH
jgi:hypothetical protein